MPPWQRDCTGSAAEAAMGGSVNPLFSHSSEYNAMALRTPRRIAGRREAGPGSKSSKTEGDTDGDGQACIEEHVSGGHGRSIRLAGICVENSAGIVPAIGAMTAAEAGIVPAMGAKTGTGAGTASAVCDMAEK